MVDKNKTCLRCGFQWLKRIDNPTQCPSCHQNCNKPFVRKRVIKYPDPIIDKGEEETFDLPEPEKI